MSRKTVFHVATEESTGRKIASCWSMSQQDGSFPYSIYVSDAHIAEMKLDPEVIIVDGEVKEEVTS